MVSTSSLSSYYKCDSSTSFPDSHGSNDGTVSGATYTSGGKINGAYDFDGTNDYVDSSLSVLPSSASACSFSMWIYDDDSGTNGPRYYSRYRGTEGIFDIGVGFDNGNKLHARVSDGVAWRYVEYGGGTPQTPPSGQWFHIVLTAEESGDLKLYVNGTLEDTYEGFNNFVSVSNLGYRLGATPGTASGFHDGKIDEVGVWSRVLTSTEVSDLYNSGSGLAYPFSAEEAEDNAIFYGNNQ